VPEQELEEVEGKIKRSNAWMWDEVGGFFVILANGRAG
jgi:hypothetical protein